MFIAVVSRSAPGSKVGLWPVAEQRQYLRNSRYHRRGDPYWKDLSCDGAYFCHLLDTQILPACEEHDIRYLQMDNARPHTINNNDVSIDAVMACHPTVRLLLQSPMSPDLNPLDQGIFNILADEVEIKSPSTRNELHEAVCAAWRSLSERKILSYIRGGGQTKVRGRVINCHGGNKF